MGMRPILFSAPMVRAILEGRKTQTRRVVKGWIAGRPEFGFTAFTPPGHISMRGFASDGAYGEWFTKLPWASGDRLWVKEQWQTAASLDALNARQIADKCDEAGWEKPWAPMRYADGSTVNDHESWGEWGRKRQSFFMPRWASRITLEVTGVRIERLQDIASADAWAEGVRCDCTSPVPSCAGNRDAYALLWDRINGDGAWAGNPWVWCVEFKHVAQEVGAR